MYGVLLLLMCSVFLVVRSRFKSRQISFFDDRDEKIHAIKSAYFLPLVTIYGGVRDQCILK